MKIVVIANIPDDLGKHFSELLRDFNAQYHGRCNIALLVTDPHRTTMELQKALDVKLPQSTAT